MCDTCPAETRWLLTLDCPLAAAPDCWLCKGTGQIHVCPSCFYLGPDRNGQYGEPSDDYGQVATVDPAVYPELVE